MGAVCCAARDSGEGKDVLEPASKSRSISPTRPRLLIMFDFDLTITVIHVFKTLAGWEGSPDLAGRCSATELGQMRLIDELDGEDAYRKKGGFSKVVLGGVERIERVRWCFSELRKLGCKLVVTTRGLVGPTRRVLRDAHLLEFFDEVYGRADEAYESSCTDYDHAVKESQPTANELQLLSKDVNRDWETKLDLLARLMADGHVGFDETFIVEDDAQEIQDCSSIARTLFVSEARGMTDDHLLKLTSAARGGAVMSNTHPATSWKVGDRVGVWSSKQSAWFNDGYVCEVNNEYIEILHSSSTKIEKVPHSKVAEWMRSPDSEGHTVRSAKVAPANDGLLRVLGMTCTACSAKPKRPARDLEVH